MWIGVSGEIAAGKTAVSLCLADALGAPFASFGNFVRAEAARRPAGADRRALQDLGAQLIGELGWRKFCLAVLAQGGIASGTPVAVIDGVRHVDAAAMLRELAAPQQFHLLYLDVPERIRQERLLSRGVQQDELDQITQHSTERDVHEALRREAVAVLAGASSAELCREAQAALGHL